MTTIGFYGGSFDPPHRGHHAVACWALGPGRVDRLIVAPVYEHPLRKRAGVSFEHRLEMCALAFGDLPGIELSSIERDLGGVSRTLRTLEALRERHRGASFRLVIGADALSDAHRWHRFDEISRIAPPLVAGRRGHDRGDSPPLFDASSTAVREAITHGERPTELVDPRVLEYIDRHGLYGGHR